MTLQFASPFQKISESPLRALLKLTGVPGMVSFANGSPAVEAINGEGIRDAVDKLSATDFSASLQYGSSEGTSSLREALVELSAERGLKVRDGELLVTSGSQQGLDLIVRATLSPGDTVVVERASYPGALQSFRLAGAQIATVDTDEDGIVPESLEACLAACERAPKLLYTVSNFSNPTGLTMSLDRRLRLLDIAVKHSFLIVEDDPYGLLRFEGESIAPIRSLTDEVPGSQPHVAYLSTLSKIAAPGLRVGWMIASPEVVHRCVMAKQVGDMCTAPVAQAIATGYLRHPAFRAELPRIIDLYRTRAQVMSSSLQQHFGQDLRFSSPEGGMFIWVRLPDGVDAQQLFDAAKDRKVLIVPGTSFGGPELSSYARLSFSSTAKEQIPTGVVRLKEALLSVMPS